MGYISFPICADNRLCGQVEARCRTGPNGENPPGWNWDVPHSGVKRDYFGWGILKTGRDWWVSLNSRSFAWIPSCHHPPASRRPPPITPVIHVHPPTASAPPPPTLSLPAATRPSPPHRHPPARVSPTCTPQRTTAAAAPAGSTRNPPLFVTLDRAPNNITSILWPWPSIISSTIVHTPSVLPFLLPPPGLYPHPSSSRLPLSPHLSGRAITQPNTIESRASTAARPASSYSRPP